MNAEQLVDLGNNLRNQGQFEAALQFYAQAISADADNFSAYNNLGNVLREAGRAHQSIPFLQAAIRMMPDNVTAKFNLAVAHLSLGDYAQGWPLYEHRWAYEHLNGLLPQLPRPQWQGENLQDKTILVIGEQGHGDIIQFSRFLIYLHQQGAKIQLAVDANMAELFKGSVIIEELYLLRDSYENYDYWSMIMSLPLQLKIDADNLPAPLQYITADNNKVSTWRNLLGPRQKLRVGFAYSGRKDSWINQHKSMSIENMLKLVDQFQDIDWINLQVDASDQDLALMQAANVKLYPNSIQNWADTAALVHNLDLVISVDTAIAHLSAAMGKPTWIPLSRFATCWRWGHKSETTPWYPTAKLFRQTVHGSWQEPLARIAQFLPLFKV